MPCSRFEKEKVMKLLERILVPTNFSAAAEDAVQTAIFVAKQFNSEICLMHVIPGAVDSSSEVGAMVMKRVGDQLQRIADQIRAEGIGGVETIVEHGVPFDQIDMQATQRDVNVIILGAGKSSQGSPFCLGTTAARIRRKASKPVWIVKPGVSSKISKILCPVDFSKSSGLALKNAIHLSREFPAELTVLTVVQGLPDYYERFDDVVEEAEETFAQKQLPQFEQFLEDFDFHDVHWNKVIRYGKPAQEIVAVAGEIKADLLVMGTVGRTGLARILMGSVTRKVAQGMPCSIATVKSEHAIRLQLDAEIADIEVHLKQGQELLEHGLAEEAMSQFRHCIAKNRMYAPAWEGLAAANRRLNHKKEAKNCAEKAKSIVQQLWDRRIEADIRSRHPLLGRKRRYL
jgi:nucleotide-binding universal stress UspA family protein